jgi:CDP-diacylglycerol--serine O-phosphatidyltransferase
MSSAYRLGKFNIDTEQKAHFVGLPTPANTLLIVSIPFLIVEFPTSFLDLWIVNPWFLIVVVFVSSYLLNSPLSMFSLKLTSTSFKGNEIVFLFAVHAVVLFVVFKVASFPLIILSYILVSIVEKLWKTTKK